MRIAYLCTTFPKLSERFFLREVRALRAQGLDFDVYSMIGGVDVPEAGAVRHFRLWDGVVLIRESLVWLWRKPGAIFSLMQELNPFRYRSLINYGENALGLAFALRFARTFAARYASVHGTWATAPGAGAFALQALVGLEFTLEAHAYDIYRSGGDAGLIQKLSAARSVRCSTESAAAEIRRRLAAAGCSSPPVVCIRRGLSEIPAHRAWSRNSVERWQLLSVGRLIEKKGYDRQLLVYRELKAQGLDFRATIIGGGPLESELRAQVQALGLRDEVHLAGKMDHAAVDAAYRAADFFIFYGRISDSGDRDGFPNVLAEAMRFSLPVFSTDVAGTTEVIRDGETGFLLDGADAAQDAAKIIACLADEACVSRVTLHAHNWVKKNFSVDTNAGQLSVLLEK